MRAHARRVLAVAIAASANGAAAMTPEAIESLWEYGDPGASETRFRAALEGASQDARLELLTQIARTYSLRKRFDQAHRTLDEVEPLLERAGPRVRLRYLLERGRTFNSAGRKEEARRLFLEAWRLGQDAKAEGLAVDAAHMVAIVEAGTPAALEWNDRGLDLARRSQDAKARALVPAMLNNKAWDLHAMRRFDEALAVFEKSRREWAARERPRQVQIATWSIARCLRSMGRLEEALAMQRALAEELEAARIDDPHVFAELAELHEALGRRDEAARYRERANAKP